MAQPEHDTARILIFSRCGSTRRALSGTLAAWGFECTPVEDSQGALRALASRQYGVALFDGEHPDVEVFSLVHAVQCRALPTVPILITSPGTMPEVTELRRLEIFDAVERTADSQRLLFAIERALRLYRATNQTGADTKIANEYEAIFDASPDMIIVMDLERRILSCNRRILERRGVSREQLVGRTCHDAFCDQHHLLNGCIWGQALQDSYLTGTRYQIRLWDCYFDIRSVPLKDRHGKLWGAMDILQDVTGLVKARLDLQRRSDLESLIASISGRFVGPTDIDEAIDETLATIGRWTRASRAYLFQVGEEDGVMRNTHEWCAEGVPSQIGRLQSVPLMKSRWWMARLASQETIYIDDPQSLPEDALGERGLLRDPSVAALMAFPIHIGGSLSGFIGLDNVKNAENVKSGDRTILRVAAEIVNNALERHRAECKRTLLATAVENSAEAIIITDAAGVVRYVNPAFEKITGQGSADTLGRSCSLLERLGGGEQPWAELPAGEEWRGHITSRGPGGAAYEEEVSVSPVRDRAGNVVHYVIISRDITQQTKLEAQLRQAQKLESIGQLAAGIAHEINTPIQYVGDNIRFLQDAFGDLSELLMACASTVASPELDGQTVLRDAAATLGRAVDPDYLLAEIPQAIEQSLHGVDRVARIVRAMKEFSHPGESTKAVVDLNRAVESTITICRNEWKYVAEMTTELDPELPPLPCFPGELNQALLNLIINAADAIAEKDSQMGRITVRTSHDSEWVELSVSDTGTGIPAHIHDRIFDPFFTTKKVGKGTGQGLAIAYSVVSGMHGGTLTFETHPGEGTTFFIRLPLTPRAKRPAEKWWRGLPPARIPGEETPVPAVANPAREERL